MCLAIMACAVCWKKVLMRNPLNVLGGNLGDFGGILQRSHTVILQLSIAQTEYPGHRIKNLHHSPAPLTRKINLRNKIQFITIKYVFLHLFLAKLNPVRHIETEFRFTAHP